MHVRIESAARLHLGFIDLHGGLGREFGSIGVALERPRLVLEAASADRLTTEGPDSDRVLEFGEGFYAYYGLDPSSGSGAHLRVTEAIPAHVGLGSGTQLASAVGTALGCLHSIDVDIFRLAGAMGRGRRSSIGIGAFQYGGFLVDGGHSPLSHGPPPIILRRHLPDDWWFTVVTPEIEPGLSGEEEDRAFEEMPQPTAADAGQIARLLVMKMLPALEERDIVSFGEALTRIQELVGDSFAPVQGGRYANAVSGQLISYLLEQGALGAGQSSWGPTVYALVRGREAATDLGESLREFPRGHPMEVYHSRIASAGAQTVVSS